MVTKPKAMPCMGHYGLLQRQSSPNKKNCIDCAKTKQTFHFAVIDKELDNNNLLITYKVFICTPDGKSLLPKNAC